ncbi:hypothetical protein SDC9_187995 [bioreactor metagenome]|uniref:Uncharacterized protein n=1 Tax=bioreactor metagenome TaxID=1076179 RepID=A0A645HN42_9ZZZZ
MFNTAEPASTDCEQQSAEMSPAPLKRTDEKISAVENFPRMRYNERI